MYERATGNAASSRRSFVRGTDGNAPAVDAPPSDIPISHGEIQDNEKNDWRNVRIARGQNATRGSRQSRSPTDRDIVDEAQLAR